MYHCEYNYKSDTYVFLKVIQKPYLITLKIAFSAKLVDLQVRVGILPLIGLITSIV